VIGAGSAWNQIREDLMVTRRHIHHVHSGWPAPMTGLIVSLVFAAILAAYAVMLILRA